MSSHPNRGRALLYKFAGFICWCLIFVPACRTTEKNQPVGRAFYFWKTVFDPTEYECRILDTLQVRTLYLRCFDITLNPVSQLAMPAGLIRITERGKRNAARYTLNPVVFITQEVVRPGKTSQSDGLGMQRLASKLVSTVMQLYRSSGLQPGDELQLDCDWTSSSREQYFKLVRAVRAESRRQQTGFRRISVTVRLHQLRNSGSAGIPPADRVLLMCYNMGNLKNPATRNSIIEADELEKYIRDLKHYPLPLDIALPLFDWAVWFRQSICQGLIHRASLDDLKWAMQDGPINLDTVVGPYHFRPGDRLRYEDSNPEEIKKVLHLLDKKIKHATDTKLLLFHLDSAILKKYDIHELESFYTGLD